MKLADNKNCTGCHACYSACPKKCIDMIQDGDGFYYPLVSPSECIQCGACVRACPEINVREIAHKFEEKAYACANKDLEIVRNSSSGGLFYTLASEIIHRGGVVFCAGYDQEWNICHVAIDSLAALKDNLGSKYVQSRIGDTYRQVKSLLKDNRLVYYSGTPCQIEGLYSYLGKKYDSLITQDILCHGVPSPKVWQKYVSYRMTQDHTEECPKIKRISFRDKSISWAVFSMKIEYGDGSAYSATLRNDLYLRTFLRNVTLRKSCYHCKHKDLKRSADITLADCWSSPIYLRAFVEKHTTGISLVILHSVKGKELFDSVCDKLDYQAFLDIKDIKNGGLGRSAFYNWERSKYFKAIDRFDFKELYNRFCSDKFILKVRRTIARKINGGE